MKRPTSGIRKQNTRRSHALHELALADRELSPSAKNAMSALLFIFQNGVTGQCNPSFEAIGKAIGLKRRATIDAVLELKEQGWITYETTRGGAKNTNRYAFAFDRITVHDPAPLDGENSAPDCTDPELQHNLKTVQNSANNGAPFRTGTTEEPLGLKAKGGSSNHYARGARAREPVGSAARPRLKGRPGWRPANAEEMGKDL